MLAGKWSRGIFTFRYLWWSFFTGIVNEWLNVNGSGKDVCKVLKYASVINTTSFQMIACGSTFTFAGIVETFGSKKAVNSVYFWGTKPPYKKSRNFSASDSYTSRKHSAACDEDSISSDGEVLRLVVPGNFFSLMFQLWMNAFLEICSTITWRISWKKNTYVFLNTFRSGREHGKEIKKISFCAKNWIMVFN